MNIAVCITHCSIVGIFTVVSSSSSSCVQLLWPVVDLRILYGLSSDCAFAIRKSACVTQNSKSAKQLIQTTQAGMLIWGLWVHLLVCHEVVDVEELGRVGQHLQHHRIPPRLQQPPPQ